jgi:periplasmic protein TonB
MFDDLVECSSTARKSKTGVGMLISIVVQALILGILILIPLIYTQALPKAFLSTLLVAPAPPPPPPPPAQALVKAIKPVKLITGGKLMAPKSIPKDITIIKEDAPPPDIAQPSVFGGIAGANIISAGPVGGFAPPPPPKAATPARIKQGGNVTAASIITQTRPVYPPLARQARIQGSVVLHAIIDKDGKVAQLEVVSGHPLLVQAALDAVREWRYKPTELNGDPVEVDTTITVTFTMGG